MVAAGFVGGAAGGGGGMTSAWSSGQEPGGYGLGGPKADRPPTGRGGPRGDAGAGLGAGFRAGLRNADLRSTSQGGWCYVEHEFFRVFLPLIGPEGGMVYVAMTRLAPLAAARAELPVTVEALARESCVSRSTAHRKLRELVQLGMVLESKGSSRRPSAYQLVALRELARVGEPELRRRLAELHSQRSIQAKVSSASVGSMPAPAQLDLAPTLFPAVGSVPGPSEPALDAACKAAAQAGCETPAETSLSQLDALVSQQSDPVSQPAAAVSQQSALVSQPGISFHLLKKEPEREDSHTPPTPQGGPGGSAGIGSSAASQPEPALQLSAFVGAARWVLEQSGVSATRRLESLLNRQFELAMRCAARVPTGADAAQQGCPAPPAERALQALAARMVERWRQYRELCRRQELQIQWGFSRFFGDGLWAEPEAWPRRAQVMPPQGRHGAPGLAAAAQAERYREPGILRSATSCCNMESWRGAAACRSVQTCRSAADSPAPVQETARLESGEPSAPPRRGAARQATEQSQAGMSETERREAEQRQAALGYWRRMRQRGVPIYAQEAPLWVRAVLEAEPRAAPG